MHLSEYLHNLGNFLHFQENKILKRLVILQNKWATDAVYRVLDNEKVKANKGYFSTKELASIWSEDIYEDHLLELLELMLKFELCYALDKKDTYLLPQLLPESRPENFTWSYDNNLQLRYHYQFMPKGILSRFMVRIHTYIKEPTRAWKNGVVLTKNNTHAFVEEVYGASALRVYVFGEEPRDFLILIAEKIEQLNAEFEGILVTKEVPCICAECKASQNPSFYAFQDIKKAIYKGGQIQCRESVEMVDARILLDKVTVFDERNWQRRGIDKGHQEADFDKLEGGIHIHNHLPTSTTPPPLPIVVSEEATTLPSKKFYQEWWFKNILAGIGVGIFGAICSHWSEACHFFTGFLIGFGSTVFLLFLRGNPERRFFRFATFSFVSALSVFALQFGFSYKTTNTTPKGKTELVIEWLSEYDWAIAILLLLLSALLFYFDYQRDKK